MVRLYENRKSRVDIVFEYGLTASALDKWIKNHQVTGLLATKDNHTEEENELDSLLKENQRLLIKTTF